VRHALQRGQVAEGLEPMQKKVELTCSLVVFGFYEVIGILKSSKAALGMPLVAGNQEERRRL
jgi:hypothetical protein